jgi:hypothetical protein
MNKWNEREIQRFWDVQCSDWNEWVKCFLKQDHDEQCWICEDDTFYSQFHESIQFSFHLKCVLLCQTTIYPNFLISIYQSHKCEKEKETIQSVSSMNLCVIMCVNLNNWEREINWDVFVCLFLSYWLTNLQNNIPYLTAPVFLVPQPYFKKIVILLCIM